MYQIILILKQKFLLKDKDKDQEIEIVKTTLKIPNNIIKELKHISIDSDKTLTEIIIEALSDYLKKRDKKI
jgi:hypothetical protein